MKRGIRYNMPAAPLTWRGYRVVVDHDAEQTARAYGVFFWRTIAVNRNWFFLSLHEQLAVLTHEAAHCRYWHAEIRLLLALTFLFWTRFARWVAHQQEYQADRYAADAGYIEGMVMFLQRHRDGSHFHPSPSQRITALRNHVLDRFEGANV